MHVIYDRPVIDLPFAAAVDSPVQWVFDRTGISGLDRLAASPAPARGTRRPQYLAISLSAADEYVDVPAATLREQFLPALAELFPAAREAQVDRVLRHPRAAGDLPPGARHRPGCGRGAATQLPGLVLAGAWTDTGWPDTMESAVRSGLAAAIELRRAVLSVPGLSRSGSSRSGFSRIGVSRPRLSRAGFSDSALSGSEANASTSTMGVRQ